MASTLGGVNMNWRGRQLQQALNRAMGQTLSQIASQVLSDLQSRTHVITGEMRDSAFVFVGPAGASFDPSAGRFRGGGGRFVSGGQSGPLTLSAGFSSDHAAYEMARGGTHDPLHPAMDAGMRTVGMRLQGAMRGQGW